MLKMKNVCLKYKRKAILLLMEIEVLQMLSGKRYRKI